uniref:Ig-like domain-containing protein n=1 Tax=Cyprinodon variegatus TaxID=28743 RepID=A0A3Q2C7Y6_CYPVA
YISSFFVKCDVMELLFFNVSAVKGKNATLHCETGKYTPFKVLEWSRPGTKREFVLIFKTQSSHIEVPTPSYEGRVNLETTENGDMSLILKNVTAADKGRYECYVLRKTNRRKRAELESVNTVYLDVLPPPSGESVCLWIRTSSSFLL